MEFIIPDARNKDEAESVYAGIAKFVQAPILEDRIWKLIWKHNGMDMECEVGNPLPSYYQVGDEPVLAIYDCANHYKICTPNRGGIRGGPVLAGKDYNSSTVYFNKSNTN